MASLARLSPPRDILRRRVQRDGALETLISYIVHVKDAARREEERIQICQGLIT